MAKVIISSQSYNEIEQALAALNLKPNEQGQLIIEKGTQISAPHDYKQVTIRRDVTDIAAKAYNSTVHGENFVGFASNIYEFVLNGKISDEKKQANI